MAAKSSWHIYGTKLRHCHPMYTTAGAYCRDSCNGCRGRSLQCTVALFIEHLKIRATIYGGRILPRLVQRVPGAEPAMHCCPIEHLKIRATIYIYWKISKRINKRENCKLRKAPTRGRADHFSNQPNKLYLRVIASQFRPLSRSLLS